MKRKKIMLLLLILLIAWVIIDINYPFKTDLRKINALEMASLDGAMWRSYYEKKPVKLFIQSSELMRNEFHFPFWRSFLVSYYNAKGAFVFKDGQNHEDYEKALPWLVKFYRHINDISEKSFNVDSAAGSELEWWIIRRYRQEHSPGEWEEYLAETAAVIYHIPPEQFKEYAHLRIEAMLLRDKKDTAITEHDWQQVNQLLLASWQSFSKAVQY